MWSKIDPFRLILLATFGILSILSLRGESPTWDEPRHLALGYRFLKTLDANVIPQDHPSLLLGFSAIPLLVAGRPLEPLSGRILLPRTAVEREIRKFYRVEDGANFQMFAWAKFMIVIVALLLAGIVYEVAFGAYGLWGARLALTLFIFDPNILAHARLVTTDIGISLGALIFLVCANRWGEQPGWKTALVLGAALGISLLIKHSAISLLAFFPIVQLIHSWPQKEWRMWRMSIVGIALAITCALVIVWGFHRFAVGPVRGGDNSFTLKDKSSLAEEDRGEEVNEGAWGGQVTGWIVPAPEYVKGIRFQLRHVIQSGHPTYLRGEHSKFGWRSYFPTAFLIKTPIPTLLFFLAMAASALWFPFRRWEIIFAVFALFLFGLAVKGSLNIGLRHILPIYPPLFVLVGRLASPEVLNAISSRFKRLPKWTAALLLVWLVVGTVRIHPHYLASFNEFIGGPKNGWKYLVGPDLDWGQDLPGLARWMRANHVPSIQLSYYGTADPASYGITWTPIQFRNRKDERPSLENLEPGYYAVSTSNLVEVMTLGKGPMTAFQTIEPVATIGYSMNVYRINPRASSKADVSPHEGSEGR